MIRPSCPSSPRLRPALLALACLAIALRILIPPGFMAAAAGNDLPFPIVLCTAQGAVTVDAGEPIPGHGDSESGGLHHSPCVFSGAAVAAPPADPIRVEAPTPAARLALASGLSEGLVPGRGLAAPPPPSRGPPASLT